MWIVSLLADTGVNIMGFYYFYLIPVGAMFVGVLSGAGYAMASRKLNMTLTPSFMTSMVLISLLDYLANQYVTYASMMEHLHLPSEYSFFNYLRDICENMTFNRGEGAPSGKPIGMFGYLFKGLEVLGYVAGSTIPAKMALVSVAETPDCLKCRQYYEAKRFGYLNAPEQWQDMANLPFQQRIQALSQSCAPLYERTDAIMIEVEGKTFSEVSTAISKLESKAALGNTASVTFTLRKCPGCDAFHLKASLVGYNEHGSIFNQHIKSVESKSVSEAAANT